MTVENNSKQPTAKSCEYCSYKEQRISLFEGIITLTLIAVLFFGMKYGSDSNTEEIKARYKALENEHQVQLKDVEELIQSDNASCSVLEKAHIKKAALLLTKYPVNIEIKGYGVAKIIKTTGISAEYLHYKDDLFFYEFDCSNDDNVQGLQTKYNFKVINIEKSTHGDSYSRKISKSPGAF